MNIKVGVVIAITAPVVVVVEEVEVLLVSFAGKEVGITVEF